MGFAYQGGDLSKLFRNGVNLDLSHLFDNMDSIKLSDDVVYVKRRVCRMETDEGSQNWMSCSVCDADYYDDQPVNYCPNCGAKVER